MSENNDKRVVNIQLLNRSLTLKTHQDKTEDLQKAAHYLDSKMRELQLQGAATGNERIALLAALNICYELLNEKKQKDVYLELISDRISELQHKLEEATAPDNEKLF